jgi:hypothetical protein
MYLSHPKRKRFRGISAGRAVWLNSLGDRKLLITRENFVRRLTIVALDEVS